MTDSINPNSVHVTEPSTPSAQKEGEWNGRNVSLITAGLIFIGATLTAVVSVVIRAWKIYSMDDETAERMINEKFRGDFVDSRGNKVDFIEKIKHLEAGGIKKRVRLLSRLALCNESEVKTIKHVLVYFDFTNVANKNGEKIEEEPMQFLVWILHGAHVHVKDDAKMFNELKTFKGVTPRVSSHPCKTGQGSLRGLMFKELLFGDIELENYEKKLCTYSWFQLENQPITNLFTFILHIGDYFKYKWTGKNQGPYGSSIFTDKNPLVISQKQEYFDRVDPIPEPIPEPVQEPIAIEIKVEQPQPQPVVEEPLEEHYPWYKQLYDLMNTG